jgi:hypothetical protein
MNLMNSNSKSPIIVLFTIAVLTGIVLVIFSQSVHAAVGISINYGQNVFNDGNDGLKGGKWDSKQQESVGTDCSSQYAPVQKHAESLHKGDLGKKDKIVPPIPSLGTDTIMDCVP